MTSPPNIVIFMLLRSRRVSAYLGVRGCMPALCINEAVSLPLIPIDAPRQGEPPYTCQPELVPANQMFAVSRNAHLHSTLRS